MTELEQAMREFEARNQVVQCAPVTNAKQARELARLRRQREREQEQARDSAERAERNAENKRYDAEGVWYVGGFQ